jgi:hypothetical protein
MSVRGFPALNEFKTTPHFSCFASGNSASMSAGVFTLAVLDTFDMNNGGFATVGSSLVTVHLGGMWLLNWGINIGPYVRAGAGAVNQIIGNVTQNPAGAATLLQQFSQYIAAGTGADIGTGSGGVCQLGSTIEPVFLAAGDILQLQGRVGVLPTGVGHNSQVVGNAAIGLANTFIAGIYLGPTM